jgi:hypothetical protein
VRTFFFGLLLFLVLILNFFERTLQRPNQASVLKSDEGVFSSCSLGGSQQLSEELVLFEFSAQAETLPLGGSGRAVSGLQVANLRLSVVSKKAILLLSERLRTHRLGIVVVRLNRAILTIPLWFGLAVGADEFLSETQNLWLLYPR